MTGSDRRQEILKNIKESDRPVSGSKLAKDYDVSRQVIVQDIALLRASGYDIISTNRGYVLEGQTCAERVFKVRHTDEQLETELCTIVDLGGQVKNVMVNHKVYGHIEAELGITSSDIHINIAHAEQAVQHFLKSWHELHFIQKEIILPVVFHGILDVLEAYLGIS